MSNRPFTADRPPRVLLCTADVGCGHGRAATALTMAIRNHWPTIRAQSLDALDATPRWFNHLYRDAYLALAKLAPLVSGWLYNRTDIAGTPPEKGLGLLLETTAMRRFCNSDAVRQADLIICTHFLCARTLSKHKSEGKLRAPIAVVITDQHPHAIWRVPNADLFLVASEGAAAEMRRHGIEPHRLLVTGIPIDARFDEPISKSAARARHGIAADAKVVLITGGGLGLGGLDHALDGVLSRGEGVLPIVVCGRNDALRAKLERRAAEFGDRCRIIGLTHRMHELMAAADVMVGKPGGLTTSEATAMGLPMVLLNPLPGQEEHNARVLIEAGAAAMQIDPYDAGVTAARLVRADSVLHQMQTKSAAFGRPHSAREAASAAMALCSGSGSRIRTGEGWDEGPAERSFDPMRAIA